MEMKIRTFDVNVIAELMMTSEALEQGTRYMKCINPGVSDDVAKLSAIKMAQEFCQRMWYNDNTGYIANERVAFREFEKDVKAGRYFSTAEYMCPRCKSTDITKASAASLFFTRRIWNGFKGDPKYTCNKCRHKWD